MLEAGRLAAHLTHEAGVVKSLVEDAIENGVHAARRAGTPTRGMKDS